MRTPAQRPVVPDGARSGTVAPAGAGSRSRLAPLLQV